MSRNRREKAKRQRAEKAPASVEAIRPRLYLITPPAFDLKTFVPQVEQAFAGGDIGCLQLRLKDADEDTVFAAADALYPIARAHDAAFILNDRPDWVEACHADGVHLGQEDLARIEAEMESDTPPPLEGGGWEGGYAPRQRGAAYPPPHPSPSRGEGAIAHVRSILGPRGIIGVSAHASSHLAMEAGEQGADYVAFGAFFPTPTKSAEKIAKWGVPDVELVEGWSQFSTLPCVAIGGMHPHNLAPLVTAGADFIGVITGVWDHSNGPKAAVTAYNDAIDAAFAQKQERPALSEPS